MITYFRSLSSCYRVTLFATPYGIYSTANGPLHARLSVRFVIRIRALTISIALSRSLFRAVMVSCIHL